MRRLAALSAALALCGALGSAAAEPKPTADPDLAKSDAALLQDDAKATAEFQRRLRGQVAYRNGLLIIVDRSGTTAGVTVMPATVFWGVDCSDSGISVTFGTGSGDSDNGISLQLTTANVPDEKCLQIAPALGQTLLDIVKGN